MPMPPSQCVRLRQNSTPCGSDSMSVRMLAPVVVNPDMVSKKASVNEGMLPERMKGRLPKRAAPSQPKVTTAKLSRTVISAGRGLSRQTRAPEPVVARKDQNSGRASPSP